MTRRCGQTFVCGNRVQDVLAGAETGKFAYGEYGAAEIPSGPAPSAVREVMTSNHRTVSAPPEKVWSVLADGWLYPLWVVGAARIRDVDTTWPQKGAKIQHSVGLWPALIDDNTEVLDVVPGHSITLQARSWPLGEATVKIDLAASGAETHISMAEEPTSGPGRLFPPFIIGPSLKWRNTEALRRLALLAENRP